MPNICAHLVATNWSIYPLRLWRMNLSPPHGDNPMPLCALFSHAWVLLRFRQVTGSSPPCRALLCLVYAFQRMPWYPARVSSLRGDAGSHWPSSRSVTRFYGHSSSDENRRMLYHGAMPFLETTPWASVHDSDSGSPSLGLGFDLSRSWQHLLSACVSPTP